MLVYCARKSAATLANTALLFALLWLSMSTFALSMEDIPAITKAMDGSSVEQDKALEQGLGLWAESDPSTEIQIGEWVMLAFKQRPASTLHWFADHPEVWRHWLAIQDYLSLCLASLNSPESVVTDRANLMKTLENLSSEQPLASEYLNLLQQLPQDF
ncbi:MAG: hypothetical protein ACPGYX_10255 [Oceanobacter sp.]